MPTMQAKLRMATDIPASITTPDRVETPLGTLRLFDGLPDEATVKTIYDDLDFQRGVQAFLTALPAASLYAVRTAFRGFGPDNQTVLITGSLMDSRTLLMVPNTETVYNMLWLDTTNGPLVLEVPPHVLGLVNDCWSRYVADVGMAGADKGRGGKYLLLPPDHAGPVPDGYLAMRSRTFGNLMMFRAFAPKGDTRPAVEAVKRAFRAYPLARAANPPATTFVDVSGVAYNTVFANDSSFFEQVAHVVREEPLEAIDAETRGLLAAVGIRKDAPFAPDARMQRILAEAAAVGNATGRTLAFDTRNPAAPYYPGSAWQRAWIGNYEFSPEGVLDLESRAGYFYMSWGVSPAMGESMVGVGSQYALAVRDAAGRYLDGARTYKLHLPPNIPAKDFWSVIAYDPQTRSLLQTDQRFPSVSSQKEGLVVNADSSIDLYFGPKPPAGKDGNWVQTIPGKGWFVGLRLYGPLEPWFDQTWRPGEIEDLGVSAPAADKGKAPTMATAIPSSITTPNRVETRLGTLNFFDGLPDEATVQTIYHNLDYQHAARAFLTAFPAACLAAMRAGIRTIGSDNQTVLVSESLLDSRSLVATANAETVYSFMWLDTKDGPLVIDVPPGVLGFIDDIWERYVGDLGNAGPDKGKGGKYLLLPPGYTGSVPDGYFVLRSRTYGQLLAFRGFLVNGDPRPSVENAKKNFRVYPLARAANPPAMTFVDVSGRTFNTLPANDASLFDEVARVVAEEPLDAVDPEVRGLLAAIGIRKGTPFAPDARMTRILNEAASVANAAMRANLFSTRDPGKYYFPNSTWQMFWTGRSHEFSPGGVLNLDARSAYYYVGVGVSPAMTVEMVGIGSQYAWTSRDAAGRYLDGGRTYRMHLPAGIPAKDFWSVIAYDPQTRSMLQTDQKVPGTGSQNKDLHVNPDTSVDVYFAPEPPPGKDVNWIQTLPGKGFFVALRLYGPLKPWFDKTWQPGEFEEVESGARTRAKKHTVGATS